jgi:hypothetical protein
MDATLPGRDIVGDIGSASPRVLMHQTTIRFGADLWRALSSAAEGQGTSVAQYVREAAVARMAQESVGTEAPDPDVPYAADTDRRRVAERRRAATRGADARSTSRAQADESLAVWAQGRQARARARAVRAQSARIRADRPVATDVVLRLREERLRRADGRVHGAAFGVHERAERGTPVHATGRRA